MKSRLLHHLNTYKELMINENDERILIEMINDFKNTLIKNSKDTDLNYYILETFYNIESKSVLFDRLDKLENILLEEGGLSIPNIKKAFMSKHDKIIERDKKWLSSNKKKILGMNYEGVEIEVLSDYKVTFEQLLNRHNIFDKLFINSKDSENLSDNLRRFEDKNENLKNGLDNYFRTGTSRREIGLRKLSGDEAKEAIENMIAYCESFLTGRKFIEEKMNAIILAISEDSVNESLTCIDKLRMLTEDTTTSKKQDKNDDFKSEDSLEEELEDDVTEEDDINEENNDEQITTERGINDRQVGVAVLLTVAEERYFDYINLLKDLIEE